MRIGRNLKSDPKRDWSQVIDKHEVNRKVLRLMVAVVIQEQNHVFTILEFLSSLSST